MCAARLRTHFSEDVLHYRAVSADKVGSSCLDLRHDDLKIVQVEFVLLLVRKHKNLSGT